MIRFTSLTSRQHLTLDAGKGATRTAHLTGFLRSFSLGSLGFTVAVAAAAAVVVAITDAVGAAAASRPRLFICTIEMPRLDGRNVIGLGPAKAGLHSKHEEIALDPFCLVWSLFQVP